MFNKIMDRYFLWPILIDFTIVATLWYSSTHLSFFQFQLTNKENQLNILSSLIDADVSLAGFILAALTIIVTFKSNLKAKGMDNADNALELIFSSKHYDSIVTVFKKSMIELILSFIFVFCMWMAADNFSITTINRVNVTGITLTTLAIFRSLYILFVALNLAKNKQE